MRDLELEVGARGHCIFAMPCQAVNVQHSAMPFQKLDVSARATPGNLPKQRILNRHTCLIHTVRCQMLA